MRPGDSYQAVGDSLQADVMRFMAIIAFCLIAILALVRDAEPARAPGPAVAPVDRPEPATSEPVATLESVATLDSVATLESVAAPDPVATPEPATAPEPASAPEPVAAPDLAAVPRPAPQPAPKPEPVTAQPSAPSAPAATEGLSLRFASDQDFLRLVNRGAIRVFAFNDQAVLALRDDFSFHPAAAPGRVHELLPETIPALMAGALARADGAAGYRWGIAMPDRMARQIRGFVDSGATGELVIDRYGQVRHHGA